MRDEDKHNQYSKKFAGLILVTKENAQFVLKSVILIARIVPPFNQCSAMVSPEFLTSNRHST
jgi:hypothetical protein